MTRNEAADLLDKYTQFLIDDGYADLDVLGMSGERSAVDIFMGTKKFNEQFPLILTSKNKRNENKTNTTKTRC